MERAIRLSQELDYLAHLVMREGRKDRRIPLSLRNRISSISRAIYSSSRRTPENAHTMERLEYALHRGDPMAIYDALHQFRNAIREETYHASSFALQRVAELEAEVERLKEEQETQESPEETKEEPGNSVKKFSSAKDRAFVIIPFTPDFEDVWTGGIQRACKENDFAALRVDQVSLSSWITDDVEEYIKKSTTVIADVTGNNPNVLFELGYALAKGKDPIIIVQRESSEKVPFDITGLRHIEYEDSWKGIEQLAKDLKKYLVMTSERQKKRKSRKKTSKPKASPANSTKS